VGEWLAKVLRVKGLNRAYPLLMDRAALLSQH
jgi:hypothetical protein